MSSGVATRPVQHAAYGVLSADATLASLSTGGVFDTPANSNAYPYTAIFAEAVEERHDTLGMYIRRLEHSVRVFSAAEGNEEVTAIGNRVAALLDRQALTVSGWTHIGTRLVDSRVERGLNEGWTRRGTYKLETWVSKAVS